MAFNLEDFEVKQPLGLLTKKPADDKDEETDVEMNEFHFDNSDNENDFDNSIDDEESNEISANDDHSNANNPIIKNQKSIINLARANSDFSFLTSIEDKITSFKEKYKKRVQKAHLKNAKMKKEDDKWNKTIKEAIKKSDKKPKKDDTKYSECGDISSDFAALGVSRIILKGIRKELKWNHPTPVQRDTIPLALKGFDLLINAITGSGKSGAFIIPILQRLINSEITDLNERRILIITPTRELAIQIYEVFGILISDKYLSKSLSLSLPIIGGVECEKQINSLTNKRCDIMVATPGRLIDLIRNYFKENDQYNSLLSNVEILVLDEADRLLDMGFQPELFEIFKHLPSKEFRQNILCSATLSDSVLKLAKISLNNDNMKRVCVDPSLALNTGKLTQEFIRLHSGQEKYRKAMLMALLLTSFFDKKCIIFCRTKKETHLMRIVGAFFDLRCGELHGDMCQYDRLCSLEAFKKSKEENALQFLFCTDVASRGIDINNVDLVINMEFPTNIKTYIHRVGRTARAGKEGYSCTFVSDSRKKLLKKIIQNDANKNGIIKSRTLNHEFVLWCFAKINDMKNETAVLLKSENKEREMRLMHIKLKRSQNLLVHRDEIFGREKKSWIMSANDKLGVKKEAQRKDLGAIETRKLMTKDEIAKEMRKQKAKQERKRELAWSKKLGGKAISMKKKQRKEMREKNRTKTGGETVDVMKDTVDMIKNPFKYNKSVKKNIVLKMKKRKRNYSGVEGEMRTQFRSRSGRGVEKKFSNKQVRKRMRAKGNKTRFKNRRKR